MNLDTKEGRALMLRLLYIISSRTNIGTLKILSRLVTSVKEEDQIRRIKNFIRHYRAHSGRRLV